MCVRPPRCPMLHPPPAPAPPRPRPRVSAPRCGVLVRACQAAGASARARANLRARSRGCAGVGVCSVHVLCRSWHTPARRGCCGAFFQTGLTAGSPARGGCARPAVDVRRSTLTWPRAKGVAGPSAGFGPPTNAACLPAGAGCFATVCGSPTWLIASHHAQPTRGSPPTTTSVRANMLPAAAPGCPCQHFLCPRRSHRQRPRPRPRRIPAMCGPAGWCRTAPAPFGSE